MLLHPLALGGLVMVAVAFGYTAGFVRGWFQRERKYLEDAAAALRRNR